MIAKAKSPRYAASVTTTQRANAISNGDSEFTGFRLLDSSVR
jgi:hypothetical protein